jgi:hypothetical protein
MATDKIFTLFWRTGDRDLVSGRNIAEAMTLAGYGGGSIPALDFHAERDCRDHYEWDAAKRSWEMTPKHPLYSEFQLAVAQMAAHNQHHE